MWCVGNQREGWGLSKITRVFDNHWGITREHLLQLMVIYTENKQIKTNPLHLSNITLIG